MKLRSRDAQKIIHEQRQPAEQRLECTALLFFFGRQKLPLRIDRAHRDFNALTIKVLPSSRSREFIARTAGMFASLSVRYFFASRRKTTQLPARIGRIKRANAGIERL